MARSERDGRIDYLEFDTPDMARAKGFYGAVFGWTFTDWGPEYASFEDRRISGGFRLRVGENPGRAGSPLVIFYADDIASTEAAVVAAGGTVTERHEFPGGRRFHFLDPVGNQLAVWTEVKG